MILTGSSSAFSIRALVAAPSRFLIRRAAASAHNRRNVILFHALFKGDNVSFNRFSVHCEGPDSLLHMVRVLNLNVIESAAEPAVDRVIAEGSRDAGIDLQTVVIRLDPQDML